MKRFTAALVAAALVAAALLIVAAPPLPAAANDPFGTLHAFGVELAFTPTNRAETEQCIAETINLIRRGKGLGEYVVENTALSYLREITFERAGQTVEEMRARTGPAVPDELKEHLPGHDGMPRFFSSSIYDRWHYEFYDWDVVCAQVIGDLLSGDTWHVSKSEIWPYLTVAVASRSGVGDDPKDSSTYTHVRNATIIDWKSRCWGATAEFDTQMGLCDDLQGDPDPDVTFRDVDASHIFLGDIETLAASGITKGCNPPANDRFCPNDPVTRGQMAAFLNRALGLEKGTATFSDTTDSVFAVDIASLADAGITRGCAPDRFCPNDTVTRGQMAAFLNRALSLPKGTASFSDTDGHTFEADIAALASAGITKGCATNRFCPNDPVTRGQMAAFLVRAGLTD